jgi:hypothetical protein
VKAAPVQGVETKGNAGFDYPPIQGLPLTQGLPLIQGLATIDRRRRLACSVQIALPSLQAHEAVPVR